MRARERDFVQRVLREGEVAGQESWRLGESVLEGVLGADPPLILYHYTSQAGLLGIATTRMLWATNMAYLNDTSEYEYGSNVIRAAIKRRRTAESEKHDKFLAETESAFSAKAHDFCQASLTESGDLLSQWRGYTENGNGYCVGFDANAIRARAGVDGEWLLTRCEYRPSRQEEMAEALVDQWFQSWEKVNAAPQKLGFWENLFGPSFEFAIAANVLALSFKDPSYSEEREWRVVINESGTEKVRFRTGKSMITPYLEIDLRPSQPEQCEVAMKRVIVGPCPHPSLAADSVRMLLDTKDYKEVEVIPSVIPFRAW